MLLLFSSFPPKCITWRVHHVPRWWFVRTWGFRIRKRLVRCTYCRLQRNRNRIRTRPWSPLADNRHSPVPKSCISSALCTTPGQRLWQRKPGRRYRPEATGIEPDLSDSRKLLCRIFAQSDMQYSNCVLLLFSDLLWMLRSLRSSLLE